MLARHWNYLGTLGLAVLITIASGLLHGRMSQRWGVDERLAVAAQQLQGFPQELGDWRQESEFELSRSAVELLECRGYVQRGYRNLKTGDFVKLALMVGPGSKMSIHVPEICFESNNFTLLDERQRLDVPVGGRSHAFWRVRFRLNDVSEQHLQVYYGWSDGADWVAPSMPRWSLAGEPVLFKLQVSYSKGFEGSAGAAAGDRLVTEFLQQVIPRWAAETTAAPSAGVTVPSGVTAE